MSGCNFPGKPSTVRCVHGRLVDSNNPCCAISQKAAARTMGSEMYEGKALSGGSPYRRGVGARLHENRRDPNVMRLEIRTTIVRVVGGLYAATSKGRLGVVRFEASTNGWTTRNEARRHAQSELLAAMADATLRKVVNPS